MNNGQSGGMLIELMVAIAISLTVTLAIIVYYTSLFGAKTELYARQMVASQLLDITQGFNRHLSRTGYWFGSYQQAQTGSYDNPFMGPSYDVYINGANDCILFVYDYDDSGNDVPALGTTPSDERFGFRLISDPDTGHGVVQRRPMSLDSFDCNVAYGEWLNMSDPGEVDITNLSFVLNGYVVPGYTNGTLMVRNIDVSIIAASANDGTISETASDKIRINNDFLAAS